jgi:hypothetical protein
MARVSRKQQRTKSQQNQRRTQQKKSQRQQKKSQRQNKRRQLRRTKSKRRRTNNGQMGGSPAYRLHQQEGFLSQTNPHAKNLPLSQPGTNVNKPIYQVSH